jgi:hypothetical protein
VSVTTYEHIQSTHYVSGCPDSTGMFRGSFFNSISNIHRGSFQISSQLQDSNTSYRIGHHLEADHRTIADIARSYDFEQFKVRLIYVCSRDLNGAGVPTALWAMLNGNVDRNDQIIPNVDHKFLVLELSREYQHHTYYGTVSTRYFLMERLKDRIVWSWIEGIASFVGVDGLANGIVPNSDVSLRTVARAFLAYKHRFPHYSLLCFNCWYFSGGILHLLLDGISPTAFYTRLQYRHGIWRRENGGQGLSPIERIFFECFLVSSYDPENNLLQNVEPEHWNPKGEIGHERKLWLFEKSFQMLNFDFHVWGYNE